MGTGVSGFEARLLCQGLMGPGLRMGLRARVLREVIAPCAEALLGRLESSSAVAGERVPQHTPV